MDKLVMCSMGIGLLLIILIAVLVFNKKENYVALSNVSDPASGNDVVVPGADGGNPSPVTLEEQRKQKSFKLNVGGKSYNIEVDQGSFNEDEERLVGLVGCGFAPSQSVNVSATCVDLDNKPVNENLAKFVCGTAPSASDIPFNFKPGTEKANEWVLDGKLESRIVPCNWKVMKDGTEVNPNE